MPDDFLVAPPDLASALPYLIRVPPAPNGVVLKTREVRPRTSKVYCHRAEGWPDDAEARQLTSSSIGAGRIVRSAS